MNRPLEVLVFLGSLFVAGCLQSYVIYNVRADTENPRAAMDSAQLTARVVLPPQ